MTKEQDKCSGRLCVVRDDCIHYLLGLKKKKKRGRWIDSEQCSGNTSGHLYFTQKDKK